jgi:glycolate oxidase
MCVQFQPEELEQFRAVKRAFDPRELLNPGKGVPTPRRCSEYRALPDRHDHDHVHGHGEHPRP